MVDEPISEREKYFVAFFKNRPDYYLNEYRHQHLGKKWSFNIGAFLFGAFWFVYRKMYLLALMWFVLSIITNQIQFYIFTQFEVSGEVKKAATYIVPLFWAFISGFTANYFYARFATTKVDTVLQNSQSEEARLNMLGEQGGTNNIVFLTAALLFFFYLIVAQG